MPFKHFRKHFGRYARGLLKHGFTNPAVAYIGGRTLLGKRKAGSSGTAHRGRKQLKLDFNYKKPGGRTRTKTKKKKNVGMDGDPHNSLRIRHKQLYIAPPKRLYKPLGDWQYTNQCSGYLNAGPGKQLYSGLFSVATNLHMVSTLDGGPAPNHQSLWAVPDQMFDLNPFQKTTGSGVISAGLVPQSDKLHVKTVDLDIQILNEDKVATHVELICFKMKQDFTASGDPFKNIWEAAMLKKSLGQSLEVQPTKTSGSTTVGYPKPEVYGSSPFAEKMFNKYAKAIWRKSLVLDAGHNEKMLIRLHINRTFRHDFCSQKANQGIYWVKGDIFFALIGRPSPLAIVTGASGTLSTVTTAPSNIAWTSTQHYNITSLGPTSVEYDRAYANFVTGYDTGQVSAIINDIDAIIQEGAAGVTIPLAP